jgi:uncharacterized membrane protein
MLVLLNFLKSYWKIILVIVLFLTLYIAGYYNGYENEKNKYYAFINQLQVQSARNDAENRIKLDESQKVSENITKEYANAVDSIKNYYSQHPTIKWVHKDSACDTKVSSLPDSSSGIDGKAKINQSSAQGVATPVTQEMCAEDVIKLLKLQKWVTEQTQILNEGDVK